MVGKGGVGKVVTRKIAQLLGLNESTDVKTAAWLNRKSSIILLLTTRSCGCK